MSNLAWAFAAAGETQRHEKLFQAIASEAAPRVAEFRPQGFSNLAWAYSTAELSSSELFDAMASEIAKQNRAARFNPQEIVRDSVLRYKIAFIHTHAGQHCVGLREERRGQQATLRFTRDDDARAGRQERRRPDEGGLHAAGAVASRV